MLKHYHLRVRKAVLSKDTRKKEKVSDEFEEVFRIQLFFPT